MSAPSTPRRLTPIESPRATGTSVPAKHLMGRSWGGSSRDLLADERRQQVPFLSPSTALAQLHVVEAADVDIGDDDFYEESRNGVSSRQADNQRDANGEASETPLGEARNVIRARKAAARKRMVRPGLAKAKQMARQQQQQHQQHQQQRASDGARERPRTAPARRRSGSARGRARGKDKEEEKEKEARPAATEEAREGRRNDGSGQPRSGSAHASARHGIVTVGLGRPRSFAELQSLRSPLYRPDTGFRMDMGELEKHNELHQAARRQRGNNQPKGMWQDDHSVSSGDDLDDLHVVVARASMPSNQTEGQPGEPTMVWGESEKQKMDFGPPPPQRTVYASNLESWDARSQRALAKKKQKRIDAVKHIEALLDHKMNRQARWDEKRRVEHGQKMLLASVYFSARQQVLKVGLRMGRINGDKKRERALHIIAASAIQRWYARRRMARRVVDSKRQMEALQRFIIRWQNMYRLKKKHQSQEVLSTWLQEAHTQGFIIRAFMTFTRRIYCIQKFTISFIVCRKARMQLLELALQKVEAERMQNLESMKTVNELAALEHLAHTGDPQLQMLTRKLLTKSKEIKTVLGLRGNDVNAATGRGQPKKRLIPTKNRYGESSRQIAIDRTLIQQRRRHIENDDKNYAHAVQKATNVDTTDARRILTRTHSYFINPELYDRMPKGNRSSLFLMLTKGGLEQLHEEVVRYQTQELRGKKKPSPTRQQSRK